MTQIGPNLFAPTVDQLFQYTQKRNSWKYDSEGFSSLGKYITICKEQINFESQTISRIRGSKEEIYIWGVGTMTLRMLQNTPLRDANIIAFIDSNPKYKGLKLNDKIILSPEDLDSNDIPILISSWIFQDEIEEQIRFKLKLSNPIIKLRND